MKGLLALIMLVFSLNAEAIDCRGQVNLHNVNLDVLFSVPEIKVGSVVGFWHPVTYDTENVVELKIIFTEERDGDTLVIGVGDYLGLDAFVSFVYSEKDGRIMARNVRGFEGPNSYGPVDIECAWNRPAL